MNLKRALLFVHVLLAGLAALSGARLAETLFHYSPGRVHEAEGPKNGRPSAGRVPGNPDKGGGYHEVIQRDVLGAGKGTADARGKIEESIRPTSLGLDLVGTVVGENQGSYAFIADRQSRLQEVYGLNDFVQGARVVDILKDKVILSVKGGREALEMQSEPTATGDKGKAKPVHPRSTSKLQTPVRKAPSPPQARPPAR